MTDVEAAAYAGILLSSGLLSLVLTPLAFGAAVRLGILDHPGGYKVQKEAMPYLGGVAIVVAFAITVGVAGLLAEVPSGKTELVAILATGLALSVMGLVDDLRGGLGPFLRLVVEVAAGLVVWKTTGGAELFNHPVLDALVTVFWVVGVTNAFNLLDNMDGLSGGVAAIAGGTFFLLAVNEGQFLVGTLAIASVGCALGFLRHNFHPARVYMGDAGALFLGFLLSVIALKLEFVDAPRQVAFFVPILVLGVAIFDTTLVTTARVLHKRNPLSGGRDHTSHRLEFLGLSVPTSVSLIYAASVACGWLAVVMARVDRTTGFLLMAFAVAVASFFGVILGRVPVYETSRRRRLVLRGVTDEESGPGSEIASA